MPRVVRNCFLEADIDGRESSISTGPRGKADGMSGRILLRHDGYVGPAVAFSVIVNREGQIILDLVLPEARDGVQVAVDPRHVRIVTRR